MVLQPDSAKSIENSAIESDLPCRQCGYNLRGLMGSGACPECGHAVAESARRNLLRDSDPSYAAKLRTAAIVMIVGLGLSGFTSTLMPPTIVIEYLDVASWSALAFLLIVTAIVVMSAGLWVLTSIDPAVFEDQRHERLRRLVRTAVLVGTLTEFIELAIYLTLSIDSILPSIHVRLILWVLIVANTIALIACVFTNFRYLRMLSWRIPDQVLARRFELLRWGFGIPFSLLTLANAGEGSLALSAWATSFDNHMETILVLNTVVWLITAFAGLFYIAALVRLWRGAVASPKPLQTAI